MRTLNGMETVVGQGREAWRFIVGRYLAPALTMITAQGQRLERCTVPMHALSHAPGFHLGIDFHFVKLSDWGIKTLIIGIRLREFPFWMWVKIQRPIMCLQRDELAQQGTYRAW